MLFVSKKAFNEKVDQAIWSARREERFERDIAELYERISKLTWRVDELERNHKSPARTNEPCAVMEKNP